MCFIFFFLNSFSDLFGGGSGSGGTNINTSSTIATTSLSTSSSSTKQSNETQKSTIQTSSSLSLLSSIEQVVPSDTNNSQLINNNNNDKLTKAYDFLKEDKDKLLNKKSMISTVTSGTMGTSIKGHVNKEEGRIQAYGWSLPSNNQSNLSYSKNTVSTPVSVPVPVYCRPLFDDRETNYKLSCAASVNLDYCNSNIKDSDTIIKSSIYFNSQTQTKSGLTSFIWLCNLNTNTDTQISIIDGNRPGEIKEEFYLKSIRVLCIHSVPGAKSSEYPLTKEQLELYESKKLIKTNETLDDNMFDDNITYIEMNNNPNDDSLNNSAQIGKLNLINLIL
jgi:c-Jun-amino-terminal kinase-interacting protein 4